MSELKNETNSWINIVFSDVIACREKYIPTGRLGNDDPTDKRKNITNLRYLQLAIQL